MSVGKTKMQEPQIKIEMNEAQGDSVSVYRGYRDESVFHDYDRDGQVDVVVNQIAGRKAWESKYVTIVINKAYKGVAPQGSGLLMTEDKVKKMATSKEREEAKIKFQKYMSDATQTVNEFGSLLASGQVVCTDDIETTYPTNNRYVSRGCFSAECVDSYPKTHFLRSDGKDVNVNIMDPEFALYFKPDSGSIDLTFDHTRIWIHEPRENFPAWMKAAIEAISSMTVWEQAFTHNHIFYGDGHDSPKEEVRTHIPYVCTKKIEMPNDIADF